VRQCDAFSLHSGHSLGIYFLLALQATFSVSLFSYSDFIRRRRQCAMAGSAAWRQWRGAAIQWLGGGWRSAWYLSAGVALAVAVALWPLAAVQLNRRLGALGLA